ncbi:MULTISPECIES: hypothetical protein [Rhizobium/Agrobacterium group]|uniref:hypothetical protein n=1 Tax=Rhizobium/Agrobacterium group TaxID=227290 RepID=UPI001F17ED5E|nr:MULTISPECIES: hypothetical protein [Rhizobium/Agrobacterium group]
MGDLLFDLALDMTAELEFVVLARQVPRVDDDFAAARLEDGCSPALIWVAIIWLGRYISGWFFFGSIIQRRLRMSMPSKICRQSCTASAGPLVY